MTDMRIKGKQREPGSGLWTDKDGSQIFVGRDYALQNEIDEVRAKTRTRSCFTECQTCLQCKGSCRDNTYPKSYDSNAGKMVDCRGCEKFRFCDCRNGVYRNTRQEPEPFTPDHLSLIEMAEGKRPLM